MKLVLVTTAVLALSASAAFADCPAHSAKSTSMEKPQTTASTQTTVPTRK